jgi:peptidyl-prolyl cis-trans isomerase D
MPTEKHINKKHLAHLEVVRRQDRIIRISAITIIVLVIGIVGYGILSNTVLMPYRAVASVNGETITAREFQQRVKLARIQTINQYMQYVQYAQMFGIQDPLNDANFGPVLQQSTALLNSTDQMGQKVVDLLIDDRLIRQEAKKRGITVSQEEVEKSLQEGMNYFPNGTPTPVITPTEIVIPTLNPTQLALVTLTPTQGPIPTATPDANATPTLEATAQATATTGPTATAEPTATPVTEQGYKDLFKKQIDGVAKDVGMDEADYRRLVESGLLRSKLLDDITKDMKPFQEQVWARHILVKTIEEADAVRTRLTNGEDFAKVAAEVSQDTSNKDKGGDLGWFGKGTMAPPFEEAAFALKVGEISQPVKSDFGFHIIQVLGHENRPLDAQKFQQDKQTALTDFLKTLRDASKVEIYDLWKTIVPTEPALPTGQ